MTTNILIYGSPGIGKTLFAALCPKSVYLDTEGSARNVTGLNRIEVKSLTDVDSVIAKLRSDPTKADTIVIDSLDELVNNYAKTEARAKGFTNKSGNLTLEGYGILRDRFMAMMRSLRDLGVNVCFVAHAEMVDLPGEGKKWTIRLPSDYAREVMAMMDVVGFMGWTVKDGVKVRRVFFRPQDTFDAKARGALNAETGEHRDIVPEFMDAEKIGDATLGKLLKLYE